jgi:hypothetical protein
MSSGRYREGAEVDPPPGVEASVAAAPAVPGQERLPNIQDEEVRRRIPLHGRRASARLSECPPQQDLVRLPGLLVLCLQEEAPVLVKVHEVGAFSSIAADDLDGELELVAAARGPGALDLEGVAELRQVELCIGSLGGIGVSPPLCKRVQCSRSSCQVEERRGPTTMSFRCVALGVSSPRLRGRALQVERLRPFGQDLGTLEKLPSFL